MHKHNRAECGEMGLAEVGQKSSAVSGIEEVVSGDERMTLMGSMAEEAHFANKRFAQYVGINIRFYVRYFWFAPSPHPLTVTVEDAGL
eukprot:scaffold53743_cov37-Cyclotella_meneghiniana.AAC.1